MYFSVVSLFLLCSLVSPITIVPGTIHVDLLPDNQVDRATYLPSSTVRYTVRFENVPLDDNVHVGIEIRGSNPNGGPRGYIKTIREAVKIQDFLSQTNNQLEFQLEPRDIFAGYTWFIRPFVYFNDESLVSTNMMNSGASQSFTVRKQ